MRDRRVFTVHGSGVAFVLDCRAAELRRPGRPPGCTPHGLGRGGALTPRRRYVRPLRGSPRRLRREAPRCRGGPRDGQGLTHRLALPDPQGDPMADRPTPTGPACTRALDRRVPGLPRREHLVLQPGDPPRRRPGGARGLPDRHAGRVHRPARRAAAQACENHTCSRGREGRLHRADARRHLARSRRRARRAAAPAGGRARPAPRQDPRGQGPDRASTTSSTTTPTRPSGLAAGTPRGAAGQPPRAGRGGVRLRRGARRVPAAGPADGVRPVDRGDPRGGHLPRHPLHPAQQRPRSCSSARASTPSGSARR